MPRTRSYMYLYLCAVVGAFADDATVVNLLLLRRFIKDSRMYVYKTVDVNVVELSSVKIVKTFG